MTRTNDDRPVGYDVTVFRQRERPISRAAALLAHHGATQRAVGAQMGRSVAVVSRQLAGLQPTTSDLHDALRRMLGETAAREVIDAIPREP